MDRFPGMAGQQLPPNMLPDAMNDPANNGQMGFLDYLNMRAPGLMQQIRQAGQMGGGPQFRSGGNLGGGPPMGGGGGFERFMPGVAPQPPAGNADALRAAIAQLAQGGGGQDPMYSAGRAAARMMQGRGGGGSFPG
jgi:hypothetical protein